MNPNLRITRAASWPSGEAGTITHDEWQAYVAGDPSLEPGPQAETACVLWTDHPKEPHPIRWRDGEVRCESPDDAVVAKLVAIAGQIDARVFGDDGQVYFIDATGAVRHRPIGARPPFLALRDADAAMRAGNLSEAALRCEEYIEAVGGLADSSDEMVVRRLAFLYGRLGRVAEAVREHDRLARHYLSKTPPDLKKARAAQLAARRLQGAPGHSENGSADPPDRLE